MLGAQTLELAQLIQILALQSREDQKFMLWVNLMFIRLFNIKIWTRMLSLNHQIKCLKEKRTKRILSNSICMLLLICPWLLNKVVGRAKLLNNSKSIRWTSIFIIITTIILIYQVVIKAKVLVDSLILPLQIKGNLGMIIAELRWSQWIWSMVEISSRLTSPYNFMVELLSVLM